jgi:aspartate racemase
MKRIGLLGGMSWESSAEYYRLINEEAYDRLATDRVLDSTLSPGPSSGGDSPLFAEPER